MFLLIVAFESLLFSSVNVRTLKQVDCISFQTILNTPAAAAAEVGCPGRRHRSDFVLSTP